MLQHKSEQPAGLRRWLVRILGVDAGGRRSPVSKAVVEGILAIGRKSLVGRGAGKRSPVARAVVEEILTTGREYIVARRERHGRPARVKEGRPGPTRDAADQPWCGLPGVRRRRAIRWRVKRSGRRLGYGVRRITKSIGRIGDGGLQILLVFAEVSRLTWIGLRRAQSIPEVRWVDNAAGRILQLVVDVLILRPGVAHRANRLAYADQITSLHILGLGVQYFMRKSVRIPYGYSPESAFPRVCCHDAGYRRAQFRMA